MSELFQPTVTTTSKRTIALSTKANSLQWFAPGETAAFAFAGLPARATVVLTDISGDKPVAMGWFPNDKLKGQPLTWSVPAGLPDRHVRARVQTPGLPDVVYDYPIAVHPPITSPATDGDPVTPSTPVLQQPAAIRAKYRGTMVEAESAMPSAIKAGVKTFRLWLSVNWSTGRINSPERIADANALIAQGYTVFLTVTPDQKRNRTGVRCKDFSVVATQCIALGLSKLCIIGGVNEANLDDYWDGGDVKAAMQLFSGPIASALFKAGYRRLATPSITHGMPSKFRSLFADMMSVAPAGVFTWIDAHCYPTDLAMFTAVFAAVADIAKGLGMQVACSEWSFKVGTAAFAKVIGDFVAVVDACCDLWCWYEWVWMTGRNPLNPAAADAAGNLTAVGTELTALMKAA